MQFQVPQFIETEDKIIGPLTLKQFLIVAAGGGIIFALFFILKTILWLLVALIIGSVTAALTFIRINGRPLPKVLLTAFIYYWKPRMYLWKRAEKPMTAAEMKLPQVPGLEGSASQKPKSFLGNLQLKLTTSKTPIQKREKALKPTITDRVRDPEARYEMMKKITGEKEVARRIDYR